MIADQMIFGLKMERRHDRRLFVTGYSAFMLAFLALESGGIRASCLAILRERS